MNSNMLSVAVIGVAISATKPDAPQAQTPQDPRVTVITMDAFEQASQEVMMSEWPMVSKVGTHLQLTAEEGSRRAGSKVQPQSPTHACFEPLGQPGRSVHLRSLDPRNGINGSDKEPLYFSFDIWLAPESTGKKPNVTFSQRFFTLASWDNDNVFSFGPSSLGGLDDTKWSFALSNKDGSGVKWIQLDAQRMPGWNHLEATVRSKEIDFTINGKRVGSFRRTNSGGFGKLVMGSGLPNNRGGGNGVSFIDNIYLTRGGKPMPTVRKKP